MDTTKNIFTFIENMLYCSIENIAFRVIPTEQ